MEIRITSPVNGKTYAQNWETEVNGLLELPASFGNARITLYHRRLGNEKWIPLTTNGMLTSSSNPISTSPQETNFTIPFSTTGFMYRFELFAQVTSDDNGSSSDSNIVNIRVLGQGIDP